MENNQDTFVEIKVDRESFADFREVGKWAGFLAIVGFITLAVMIMISFSLLFMSGPVPASMYGGSFPRVLIFLLYVVIAVVYFFPVWFLFRFADLLRKSFRTGSKDEFNQSIRYLRSFFVYIGILTIIGLVISVITFLIGVSMGRII